MWLNRLKLLHLSGHIDWLVMTCAGGFPETAVWKGDGERPIFLWDSRVQRCKSEAVSEKKANIQRKTTWRARKGILTAFSQPLGLAWANILMNTLSYMAKYILSKILNLTNFNIGFHPYNQMNLYLSNSSILVTELRKYSLSQLWIQVLHLLKSTIECGLLFSILLIYLVLKLIKKLQRKTSSHPGYLAVKAGCTVNCALVRELIM